MEWSKRSPLFIQVRQYLIGKATRAGGKPEKIEPERELSEKFGVSRVTARKAIKELITEGHLIVKPRQGTFTNPAKAGGAAYHIGVIYGSGAFMSYEYPVAMAFSGILRALAWRGCSFDVITLNPGDKPADEEIREMGLDGLLWLTPKKEVFPAFARLAAANFPIVGVDVFPGNRAVNPPPRHVLLDLDDCGRLLADHFIGRGCRGVAYCGLKGDAFKAFVPRLRARGVRFDERFHVETIEDISKKLPKLLKSGAISGLYSDGGPERFNAVFGALERYRAETESVELVVPFAPKYLRGEYPGARISAFLMGPYFQLGVTAADALYRRLSGDIDEIETTTQPFTIVPAADTKRLFALNMIDNLI